ncbi:MAG: hypothetical protein PHT58_03040 [Eubacteriales bacterium]|nr:hypothetical protein [Eubacteriales bacterium]
METPAKKTNLSLILLVVAVLCIVCATIAFLVTSDNDASNPNADVPTSSPQATGSSGVIVEKSPTPSPVPVTPQTPQPVPPVKYVSITFDGQPSEKLIEDTGLVFSDIVCYCGDYLEDGSDEYVEAIYAVLLRNASGKDIEYASLRFVTTEGEDLLFNLSNLPDGRAIIVLDANKTPYAEGQQYSLQYQKVTYYEDMSALSNRVFYVDLGENRLQLTNVSDSDFIDLSVHYKYLYNSNTFLGGISFSGRIGMLNAGASANMTPSHYISGASEVVGSFESGLLP